MCIVCAIRGLSAASVQASSFMPLDLIIAGLKRKGGKTLDRKTSTTGGDGWLVCETEFLVVIIDSAACIRSIARHVETLAADCVHP